MLNWQRAFLFGLMLLWFSSVLANKPMAPDSIDGVITVSAKDVIELILNNSELIVIDSRHQDEYNKGHIEGAINVLNTDLTLDDLQRLTDNFLTPILFYCNGERCLRSSQSAIQAKKWGYQQIYWFRQGWIDWIDRQYPVEY
ncbi:MAG: rhodanese-like domain-containing protein [Pseudomonadota bacterium]